NYHDYFIKDGRFIGRFEEMYQNVEDPWHIESLGRRLDMDAALLLIRRQARPFERTLDLGCGKGFFSGLLAQVTGGRVFACDVSSSAVDQARRLRSAPNLEFFAFDLNRIETMPFGRRHFDLIVMAQTIWCVLDRLPDILAGFRDLLKPDGGLLISQHLFQPGQQHYGADRVSRPEDLIAMLNEAGFLIEDTLETNRFANHHLALWARPAFGADEDEVKDS
ncbi:MAG: class I SAM-dependent methyltransferase, partial [Proteobacteria bacterium]|nr:class I SAM-dependent methyltransferase [Pseudomonadota bacterium]